MVTNSQEINSLRMVYLSFVLSITVTYLLRFFVGKRGQSVRTSCWMPYNCHGACARIMYQLQVCVGATALHKQAEKEEFNKKNFLQKSV